jgi:hypothetical protein
MPSCPSDSLPAVQVLKRAVRLPTLRAVVWCATLMCASPLQACRSSIHSTCGAAPYKSECFGQFSVKPKYSDEFENAGRATIAALHDPAFAASLASFMQDHAQAGPHSPAWQSVGTSSQIVAALLGALPGTTVQTYATVRGWFAYVFAGNLAYDGTTGGPIRVNRWGLPRGAASIANTFAHELAHRIGMTHPHSDDDLKIARCEPPYVVGSLVEKVVTGAAWKATSEDCSAL